MRALIQRRVNFFLIFPLIAFLTVRANQLGLNICGRIDKVVIRHRNYYSIYLGMNLTSGELDKNGIYYKLLKFAVPECCKNVKLVYEYETTTKEHLESVVLRNLSIEANTSRVFTFFFPEFAEHKDKTVYDFELKIVKLSRSPGQAVMMLRPSPQKPVFLYDIFYKSAPILLFLITLSWAVGILGWMADHWKNPDEFPNPFYKGMFQGVWWSIVTMTTVGYGDKCPKSAPARVLSVIWVLMSAVLLSLFTANATAILNASQQKVDYSKTIGKKIGVLQSKHFDEFQLNMGAHVTNYENFYHLNKALMNGTIDRMLFPNYKDILLYFSLKENRRLAKTYKIVKVFESPFQIGMVLARTPEYLNFEDNLFLKCLKTAISHAEREYNDEVGYAEISFPKQDSNDDFSALNQDNLIVLTYYILAVIAFLILLGLLWDLWCWRQKKKHHKTAEVKDIPNCGQDNVAATEAATELHEATWF